MAADSFDAFPAPDREAEARANAPNAGQSPKPRAESRGVLRKKVLHASITVAKGVDPAPELVRHGQPQVADRRLLLHLEVTVPLADAATHGHARQRIAGVTVGIAHAATVEDQRVVEHRAVAVRERAQLVEEPP